MSKKNNNYEILKEYVMPTFVLVIICFVVTFSIVSTYKVTSPIIQATAEESAEAAREQVSSGSDGFVLLESREQESEDSNEDNQDDILLGNNIIDIYQVNDGGGYVITSIDKGYGGAIKVITSFSNEGAIDNVMLLEHNETPGLGTKVADIEFTDRFKMLDSVESVESIDAISGVTISSDAVKRAVASALEQIITIKEGGL